ncbi:hypothetical protein [Methylobacterium sp. D48H]
MADGIDLRPLNLRPRELQVLQWARRAWDLVENGHALVSPNQIKSAQRLIDRGFLTKADTTCSPPADWFFPVVLTPENVEAIARAAEAA